MKKILYVILHTCTRPDRYDGIVNSWGKDVDYIFYADCNNEEKKIIKVSDDTSYKSNEEKHVNVIKFLIENDYQYEWFFFCDDDTFVNTKKIENYLIGLDRTKIYGQILQTWKEDPTLEYCSGGAGYLINKNILSKITKSIKVTNSGYSDVSLGICVKNLQIECVNNDKFNSQSPDKTDYQESDIKNLFTYHYISSKKMIELYNLL